MSAQRTIAKAVSLSGVGLHSGETTNVTFKPAPANTGMVFVRVDLPDHPRLTAHPDLLCQRQRRTAMAQGDVEVHTTEHFLSAATGLGLDNLIIEIDNVELPGMDGSAIDFCTALREAGIVDQDAARRTFTLTEPVAVEVGNASVIALPYHDGLKITYTLDDHGGHFTGTRMVELELTPDTFVEEIARARTFCLAQEVEMLRAAGLGKGANYDNTCVFDGDSVVNTELRYPDEPARHKVLDLIGDLVHASRRLNAHIIAVRSGHRENMALVQELNKRIIAAERPPFVYDIKAILSKLPHRFPFLLVDRVIEHDTTRNTIVALKNVTANEPQFQGHFPGQPVMPGVLQIEAIAQVGAIMLLSVPGNEDKVPMFMSADKVKFRRPVEPGDQMRIEVETLRVRSRMAACRGRVLVDGEICCEAEIRSMLADAE
ncbi:MAG: UDP-3-O-acyl-N-acetylglucosamine deacetylase [Planctomycetota bacterium]|jgi:UDP-3-O-[3-hydroxymyristoyl] N-acetylglucosamine deacetylase/3-hydroxyacyl-[acyl-carrier-protein] dehydratase